MAEQETGDRRLRVAVLGAGGFGAAHLRAWRALAMAPGLSGVEVVAVSSRSLPAGSLGAARVEPDWTAIVGDPRVDLVDICLPDHLHHQVASASLDAGQRVVCEKPVGLTGAECIDLVERAARTGRPAHVPLVYRNVPAVALAREMLAEGAIGDPVEVTGRYRQSWLPAHPGTEEVPVSGGWRLSPGRSSGVLGDVAVHLVDLCTFLLPALSLPLSVAGVGGQDPLRRAVWTAQYGAGVLGSFHVSRTAPGHVNDLEVEIAGTRGQLLIRVERPDQLGHVDRHGVRRVVPITDMTMGAWLRGWRPYGRQLGWESPLAITLADIADTVLTGKTPADGSGPPTFADIHRARECLDRVAAEVYR